jgi:hypothetical protein
MVAQSPAANTATGTQPPTVQERQALQKWKTRIHRRMVDASDLSKAGQWGEGLLRGQVSSLGPGV